MNLLQFLGFGKTIEKVSGDIKETKMFTLDFRKVLIFLFILAIVILVLFGDEKSELFLHITTKFTEFIEILIKGI